MRLGFLSVFLDIIMRKYSCPRLTSLSVVERYGGGIIAGCLIGLGDTEDPFKSLCSSLELGG